MLDRLSRRSFSKFFSLLPLFRAGDLFGGTTVAAIKQLASEDSENTQPPCEAVPPSPYLGIVLPARWEDMERDGIHRHGASAHNPEYYLPCAIRRFIGQIVLDYERLLEISFEKPRASMEYKNDDGVTVCQTVPLVSAHEHNRSSEVIILLDAYNLQPCRWAEQQPNRVYIHINVFEDKLSTVRWHRTSKNVFVPDRFDEVGSQVIRVQDDVTLYSAYGPLPAPVHHPDKEVAHGNTEEPHHV